MAVDMSRLDVPRDVLEQKVADLVARQREQRTEESANRTARLAPTNTTPEEGR